MSREDLADALDRTEEIHSPPKPNGAGTAALKFTPEQWEETNRLMELSPFAREHEIKAAARKLGCRVTTLRDVLKSLEHNNGDSVSEPDEERPRQRDEVAEIGQACELVCDADGVAYATVTLAGHRETWPVSSPRFRRYVLREYQRRHGRLAAGTALIEGIEGIAAIGSEGPVREVFVRIGSADGKIYLDLCRDDWKVVEVDAGGWRILKASPVPFLRPAGLRPLPLPSRDALGVARLRPLVNIPDEQEWKLYVLWLVGCFRPKGPYPILIVNGEPGAAKTGTSRLARRLVDPAKVELAKPPKSEDDLIIAAKNQWLPGYDNFSSINEDLADGLCRLATGAGLQTRKLYTDDEQLLIPACRPVVLNGIPDIASRGDLADRAVVLTAPEIPDESRREESDLDEEFVAVAPPVLGALLDGVAAGVSGRAAVAVAMKHKPRMADFAVFAAASAPAFGWTRAEFEEAYEANRNARVARVVETDAVAEAIHRLVIEAAPVKEKRERPKGKRWSDCWEGTASELLKELEAAVSEGTRRQRKWPKGPAALSNRLTRAAPGLRRLGIAIEKDRSANRTIKVIQTASRASRASKLT